MKLQLLSLYTCTLSNKADIEKYQSRIRELEWAAIESYIPANKLFLDVGCGTGYNMLKAQDTKDCEVWGIDPEPGAHGVGRFLEQNILTNNVQKGVAEAIPFPDKQFDVVFSSHVLEHVNDMQQSLSEMKRVLKDDGILIIGMPTAAMALVNLLTQWFFTTHIRLVNFSLKGIIKTASNTHFKHIFFPPSHSYPESKTLVYDLQHYQIGKWAKIVSSEFKVQQTLTPALYPYPDYIQWFPILKMKGISSSVFFICSK